MTKEDLILSDNQFNDAKEILMNYDTLKESYISKPILSIYEKTTIIGVRAQQISNGAQPLISVPQYMSDSIKIAELELKMGKTPFILKRTIGSKNEYWKVEDLKEK